MDGGTKFIVISLTIVFLCLVELPYAQDNNCVGQKSCSTCLEAGPSCTWCRYVPYQNITSGRSRCNTDKTLENNGCPLEDIIKGPLNSQTALEDHEFKDVKDDGNAIQLRPQRYQVKIRPNSQEKIKIRYRPSKNYPLDLYYLMDMSHTMTGHRELLISLASNLSESLTTLTTNFRIGFGRFCDKKIAPFVTPELADNPCRGLPQKCDPTYSFKHTMSLKKDTTSFANEVQKCKMTGNLDNLEGTLDALVQSIVCVDRIGWSKNARKIIVIASDGGIHVAGDGKLAGLVKQQDFQCHLDETNTYTEAEKTDYPSFAEVMRLLIEYKVNLVFAVAGNEDYFKELPKLLKPYAQQAPLQSNGRNVLDIISKTYKSIQGTFILEHQSNDHVNLKYYSNCSIPGQKIIETSKCEVEEGKLYEFEVAISADKCPEDRKDWKQTIVIQDVLASEMSKITVDVEILCGCDCEAQANVYCQNGVDDCGACKCKDGWSGDRCDCNVSFDDLTSKHSCKPNRNESADLCSRNGRCECGKCICDSPYSGEFCEYTACDKSEDKECAGNGKCVLGQCVCNEGWKGSACDCATNVEPCQMPGSTNGMVCSNHGYCECSVCVCNATLMNNYKYKGTYCETSEAEASGEWCNFYHDCVMANVEKSSKIKELCKTNTTTFKTEDVDEVDADHPHYCFVRTVGDSEVCVVPYIYEFEGNNGVVLKIAKKNCRNPIITGVVIPVSVLGLTILMGILSLFIWKCWTTIQDRREFAKFEAERNRTVYAADVNPIFKPAVTNFAVPKFQDSDL